MADDPRPLLLHAARHTPAAWLAAAGALVVAALGLAQFISPEWLAGVLNLRGPWREWQWLAIPLGIVALGVIMQVLGQPTVLTRLDTQQQVITVEVRGLLRRSVEAVPLGHVADIRPVRSGRRPDYRLTLLTTAGQRVVLDYATEVDAALMEQRAQAIKAILQGYRPPAT